MIAAAIAAIVVIILYALGWIMGSKSKQRDLELRAVSDINKHYEKMAEKFSEVDKIIDNAQSVIGRKFVRTISKPKPDAATPTPTSPKTPATP